MCRGQAEVFAVRLKAPSRASPLPQLKCVSLVGAGLPAKMAVQALHLIDMVIIQLQPGRQRLCSAHPDRPTLDIHQQPRTLEQR